MISLSESYKYCRKLTKHRAKNFYYSFIFLPKHQKDAIYSYYAFCRLADDIADNESSSSLQKKTKFKKFYRLLDLCYRNENINHPIFRALQKTINTFNLKKENLLNLVEGVKTDTYKKKYSTFSELYDYCYKVASEVAFVCIDIFIGHRNNDLNEYGENLGLALQMTNIIRDVAEDNTLKRRYIPKEHLDKFNISENEYTDFFKSGTDKTKFIELMNYEIQLAELYYETSKKKLNAIHRDKLLTLETIRNLYYTILKEIKNKPDKILNTRISLPVTKKIKIAFSTKFR